MLLFWTFYSSKNAVNKIYDGIHKNIKQHSCWLEYWCWKFSFEINLINYNKLNSQK